MMSTSNTAVLTVQSRRRQTQKAQTSPTNTGGRAAKSAPQDTSPSAGHVPPDAATKQPYYISKCDVAIRDVTLPSQTFPCLHEVDHNVWLYLERCRKHLLTWLQGKHKILKFGVANLNGVQCDVTATSDFGARQDELTEALQHIYDDALSVTKIEYISTSAFSPRTHHLCQMARLEVESMYCNVVIVERVDEVVFIGTDDFPKRALDDLNSLLDTDYRERYDPEIDYISKCDVTVRDVALPTQTFPCLHEVDHNVWLYLERCRKHLLTRLQRKHKILRFSVANLNGEQCDVTATSDFGARSDEVTEALRDIYDDALSVTKIEYISTSAFSPRIHHLCQMARLEVESMYCNVVIVERVDEVVFIGTDDSPKRALDDLNSLVDTDCRVRYDPEIDFVIIDHP